MIAARGLTRRFGDATVLSDVDLDVHRGEILGIVGPGGGGKTVLLKVLAGLLRPDAGAVTIDGQDFATLSGDDRARIWERCGFLFQNYALFDFMTVGQNIAFPLEQRRPRPAEAEIRERVAARLAEVDLPGTEDLFPNELSGGMKKRVAMARATIAQAQILFYDDPTAGLDPVTSSKIFALIGRLHPAHGVSVVVSHDVDRMRAICHRYVLVDQGRVRFEGQLPAARASSDAMVRTFFDESALQAQAGAAA